MLLVTGMSGAGKSSALKTLEDLGYEAVDNLPLSLLAALISPGRAFARPLAIGVDIRTRDFGVAPFIQELDELI
ncbi:MAG TPA: RNase adapter RapZ, partial [Alphaproteobacteria bacterium]|nr:RNase adapter RapZ [Alphaproteobacteria bacterium]